jgi:GNAT superfamily N-acetyltransferase
MKRFAELLQDWSHFIRRDGWRGSLPVIWKELLQIPCRRLKFLVMTRSLQDPLPDIQPRILLTIRPFTRDDLAYVKHMDRPSEARASALRLSLGHQGFIAFHQGRPVGYAWACANLEPDLERLRMNLEEGDVYFVDDFTAPAYRGHGVHKALFLARCRHFRDHGYRRAVAHIESRNAPSLAVWRKLGAREAGSINFRRIGPWR